MNALRDFVGSKLGLSLCLVLAALGVYLLATHTGHVLSALPYLLLLACPLMHFSAMDAGTASMSMGPPDENRISRLVSRPNESAVVRNATVTGMR